MKNWNETTFVRASILSRSVWQCRLSLPGMRGEQEGEPGIREIKGLSNGSTGETREVEFSHHFARDTNLTWTTSCGYFGKVPACHRC